jgi:hypothetical protein
MSKYIKNSLKILIIVSVIILGGMPSCRFSDIYDENNYKMYILVDCTGGLVQTFSWSLIADDYPVGGSGDKNTLIPFLENIKTISITVTKDDDAAALQVLILKNQKVVQAGNLAANSPPFPNTTNTLTVVWKLDESKDKSTGTSSTNNTSSSSSSSSSP